MMNRIVFLHIILVLELGFTRSSASQYLTCSEDSWPLGKYHYEEIGDGLITEVKAKFPETITPDDSVITERNYEYTITERSSIHVSFLNNGGELENSFGYYVLDHSDPYEAPQVTILFPNQKCAHVGDTITIGPFGAGKRIGFYLKSSNTTASTSTIYWSSNGRLNNDSISHIAFAVMKGYCIVGFEDLLGGGDRDFNDVIVLISSTPYGRCNRICPAMADINFFNFFNLAFVGIVIERLLELVFILFEKCKWDKTNKKNLRALVGLVIAVGIGIALAFVLDAIFWLCWCTWWTIGFGTFSGLSSPFFHQIFQAAAAVRK